MTKKIVSLLLAVLLFACISLPAAQAASSNIRYVYTANGKGLNVRQQPDLNAKILGVLPYGTQITVQGYSSDYTWATIIYTGSDRVQTVAYVMTRYLVENNPVRPQPSPVPSSDNAQKTLDSMENELKSYKPVSVQYVVVARPTRATGWVNLRLGPSSDFGHMENCYNGKQLTVLAETNNWFQVQDPVNGMIGYISRQYVTVMGVGTAQ